MFNATLNRRQFITAALGITGALGLAACGSSTTASSSSITSSSADASSTSTTSFDGNFVLGFDQDFPPYGYVGNDGSYTGFDIDLAQAVCDREGWTLVPTPISWDAKDTLLNSGQITCIWNGFTIEGREDGYAFTDPYMENRQVVVVPASSDVQQLSDLAGKNVITQADSAALDVLSEGGSQEELGKSFGNLQTIDNYNTAFMMLESGQVDAIAIDYPVAVFNIGDKTSEFRILDENLNSEHFGVGFANTDDGAQLAKTVEADLQVLDSEGTVKELCEKYADQGVSYDLWCLPKA
ncbi:transporter substrate-binding domain-containing protein [Olsenella sp. kh2p3]|uniref:transporter substrate-binding domain-containing protein n=1 Tax=Olsenella sp. kh2p3 TaxID=1797112 RepID=UPI000922985F|nr:transporter substrate-binding domain-containing protein [Olsenella sp. kh2p3]MCI2086420.1 transporter substrate-binding domain-containing protein [Olsenella sp.]SFX27172.1 amino acid ABC transporter substrate-binding protein, PAAT family (TC 3.A.1.3.-) [Olsenella sp. kh2p3]